MLDAIILGVSEGLTEFLPVSSTGHLIIFGHLLGFTGERAATFEVFIQLGAILAVVWLYRERFGQLVRAQQTQSNLSGQQGLGLLFLTTLPSLILGFLLHGFIKTQLFNPTAVAIGLALGGIAIIVIERRYQGGRRGGIETLTKKQAAQVGLYQTLSLWPGVSRAGATIIGGMLSGLDRKAAVEYSFLAAVPVMFAAVGYDLIKSLPHLQANDIPTFAIGFITAFLSAVLAIKFFVRLVQSRDMQPFGWYRLVLASLVLVML